MKKTDIYEIAIKISGLYTVFTAIDTLRDLLTMCITMLQKRQDEDIYFSGLSPIQLIILYSINFIVVCLLAYILTFKTKMIVKLICTPADFIETTTIITDRNVIYEIALVIIGLLLIIRSLPDFIYRIQNYINLSQSHMPIKQLDKSFIFTSSIKIILGLIGVIYSKGISKLLAGQNINSAAK